MHLTSITWRIQYWLQVGQRTSALGQSKVWFKSMHPYLKNEIMIRMRWCKMSNRGIFSLLARKDVKLVPPLKSRILRIVHNQGEPFLSQLRTSSQITLYLLYCTICIYWFSLLRTKSKFPILKSIIENTTNQRACSAFMFKLTHSICHSWKHNSMTQRPHSQSGLNVPLLTWVLGLKLEMTEKTRNYHRM